MKIRHINILIRFLSPIKKDIGLYVRGLISETVQALPPIISVIMIERITLSIEEGSKDLLLIYLFVFFFIILGLNVAGILCRNRGRVSLYTKGSSYFYEDIIRKLLQADHNKVEKIGTGKIIAIFQKGLEIRSSSVAQLIHFLPKFLLSLSLTIYLLLRSKWWLVLVFFGLLIFNYIFSIWIDKKVKIQRNVSRDISNERTRNFVRIIMSKFEIFHNNKIEQEIIDLNKNTNLRFENDKRRSLNVEFMFRIPTLGVFLLKILIYGIIGIGILGNSFGYSDMVVFVGALSLMESVISEMTNFIFDLTRDFSFVEKLWNTIDDLPSICSLKGGKEICIKKGNIILENVSFSYSENNILNNISLSIEGGKKIALVGPSGSGKSTIIKLIVGYINPDKGKILVDMQDLSSIDVYRYGKYIGYLHQEPNVFDGTIRKNLTYALDNFPDEKVLKRIINLSKCEFIYDLDKGIDTEIGERGVRLSGGEKQRLAIAKIMLKNPEIILLDEPTSALDSISEQKISEALENLYKNKTVIIAAHRLQTVKTADDIIVIDSGKVTQRGNHNELMKQEGIYKQMIDLQTTF